jgi:hypothetical protein
MSTVPVPSPSMSFEVKYGAQCDVDLHEFFRVQAAGEVAEALLRQPAV